MAVLCLISSGFLLAYDEQANQGLMELLQKFADDPQTVTNLEIENALSDIKDGKVDPNQVDTNNYTLLHFLAQENKAALIESLFGAGKKIEVNARIAFIGNTPLHLAAIKNSVKAIEVLVNRYGIDVTIKNNANRTAEEITTNSEVKKLISQAAFNQNETNQTLIALMALLPNKETLAGDFDSILNALKQSDSPNLAYGNKDGYTFLHFVAEKGTRGQAVQLLDGVKGIDINVQSKNQDTPLHLAARRGNLEMYEILLEKGANPELTNNQGLTAEDLKKQLVKESEGYDKEDEGDVFLLGQGLFNIFKTQA